MKNVVLYHGNCFDGMAAAWAAWKRFGDDAEYIPVTYGQDLPTFNHDSDVYILDFSYPRNVLTSLVDYHYGKVLVIDHHKTAQKDLEGLDFCIFDMEKSGARLAWEYFHQPELFGVKYPGELDIPNLIKYVEDRDLWRFALPYSHEINAYIQSWPMKIEIYDSIYSRLQTSFQNCRQEGIAIERYKDTMVKAQCKHAVISLIGGYDVPVVNSTMLVSEVSNQLCKDYPNAPFSAYYTIRGDGKKQFGLRSIGDFDVSEVAKIHGGGGHKNTAEFILE